MKIKSDSFQNYPFTDLFRDYSEWSEPIQPFFEYNPLSLSDYSKRCQELRFNRDRLDLVSSLTDYNLKFGADDHALKTIKLLKNENVYTVVTGCFITGAIIKIARPEVKYSYLVVVGFIFIFLSIIDLAMYTYPLWYQVFSILLTIPSVIVGNRVIK